MRQFVWATVGLLFITASSFAGEIPARVFYGKYEGKKGHRLYIGKGKTANDLKLQWFKNGDKEVESFQDIGKGRIKAKVPGSPSKKAYVEREATIEEGEDSYELTISRDYFDGKSEDRLYFDYINLTLHFSGKLTVSRASGDDQSDPHEDVVVLKRVN